MSERRWGGRLERSGAALRLAVLALLLALPGQAGSPDSLRLSGLQGSEERRVIREAEWAADLIDTLGLAGALPEEHADSDLFSLLCAERAERSVGAGGLRAPSRSAFQVAVDAPPRQGASGSVRVVVSVPATALYALVVEGTGPQRWAIDQRVVGHLDPSSLGVAQAPRVVPLRRGPHELSGILLQRARADRVELTAYRPLCIAPAEGWRGDRPLTFGAKARTLVRALGLEPRLPPAGDGLSIEGERFSEVSAWGGRTNRRLEEPASKGAWAMAVDSPAEFTYPLRLAEPAVVNLTARLHGTGAQIWSVDGRHRITVIPPAEADAFAWTQVVTLPLAAGDHAIRALVPRGAGIDVVRVVPLRSTDSDYLALLEEAGYREGAPDAPVSHGAALANLKHPTTLVLAETFVSRLGGESVDPLALVERELDQFYSRPLSPVLPPEL